MAVAAAWRLHLRSCGTRISWKDQSLENQTKRNETQSTQTESEHLEPNIVKSHSWQGASEPNYHHRNNQQHRVNMMGAIGSCLEKAVFFMRLVEKKDPKKKQ